MTTLENLEKPDLIVTVGGGSTIDMAKAISALYDYRREDISTLISEKGYLDNENHIPIIAVPTTAEQVRNVRNGRQYGILII